MKQLSLLLLVCIFSINVANSQVNHTSGAWAPIGDVTLSTIFNDVDNGDGVGDGAQFVDGKSTGVGQGASFTFSGTMTLGETLNIATYTYNQNSSYVRFVVELYNQTNSTVLASSSDVFIGGNDTTPVNTTLNYTATSSDVGDVLQVRYIRTDNGHTARNFAIDNLSLNGNFATTDSVVSCPFTVTPDIALEPSNASNEADINLMFSRYSDDYLSSSAPTVSELNAAITDYNTLNIVVASGDITGNVITDFNQVGFIKVFAEELKYNPLNTDIQEKAKNTIWLTSKHFCQGVLQLDHNGYEFKSFARGAILLKSVLTQDIIDLFKYMLFKRFNEYIHYWESSYDDAHILANDAIDTDYIFNHLDIQMAYITWLDTEEERLQYMKGFKRYLERFLSYSPGSSNGIKEDGSGFHHWTAYNNYMYAYQTVANVLYYMRDTAFTIDANAYQVFRDAVFNQYMQSNDDNVQALSTSGRNPHNRTRQFNQDRLKKLAIAGGDILGLATADPIFAGMYNRIYGVDADFNYSGTTPYTEGFFQFNYAHASAFRKNNWLVFNKGFSNYMWGSEIYTGENRYGRYQSYGALEIIYPGDKATGNGYNHETWDWNYNPGTTVIRLPWANLHAERGRIDELQQKRFVGTLTLKNKGSELLSDIHGDYGMFAMDFQEQEGLGWGATHSSNNHNNTFTFKKSTFYFDDIIVSLGSGINNDDASNETITALYQRLDNKGIPNVNGTSQSSSGETTFSGASSNWLLSNYNTGFYVLEGNHSLKVKKEVQQTPNENQIWPANISGNATNTYYIGYLDHGTAPVNEGYEYIVLPDSNVAEMQNLDTAIQGGNKPYIVHQKNANAHIVEHKAKNIFGYAFFNAASGLTYDKISDADASCLVMTEYNDVDKEMLISVSNPDIGFASKTYTPSTQVTRQITLQGEWTLSGTVAGVQIVSANATSTVIAFTLVDGLVKEALLIEGSANCPVSQQGTPCDDGDDCTINDVYDENCDCVGTLEDTDGDGVCDAQDQCPGFDDTVDVDNDSIPDGCDPLIDSDNDGVSDDLDQCPGFDDTVDVDNDNIPDGCDPLIDSDGDGISDDLDQCPGFDDNIDTNGNGIPDGCDVGCTYSVINFNNFNSSWGIWNDGGSDCRRSSNDAAYSNGGTGRSVRLRDNTSTSVMTTDNLDLSTYDELTIDFNYYPRSMDNSNEDFWLQISTDGGSNYTTVEEWNRGDEFNNNQRYFDQVIINGPFTSNTKLRFRCDASGNSDWVYIDDVSISGCGSVASSSKSVISKKEVVTNVEKPIADENKARLEIKLFPNPASEYITVKLTNATSKIERIRIIDLNGRIVDEITSNNKVNHQTINISSLESGVYFITTLVKGNEKTINKKLIIEK